MLGQQDPTPLEGQHLVALVFWSLLLQTLVLQQVLHDGHPHEKLLHQLAQVDLVLVHPMFPHPAAIGPLAQLQVVEGQQHHQGARTLHHHLIAMEELEEHLLGAMSLHHHLVAMEELEEVDMEVAQQVDATPTGGQSPGSSPWSSTIAGPARVIGQVVAASMSTLQ